MSTPYARAKAALDAANGPDCPDKTIEQSVCDLLTDLRHYCKSVDVSYTKCDGIAFQSYEMERG